MNINKFLHEKQVSSYFLLYKKTKGSKPVVNQWALNHVVILLDPFFKRIVNLLLKKTDPLNKTEQYLFNRKVLFFYEEEDLYQSCVLCFLKVIRRINIKKEIRLYDLLFYLIQELSKEVGEFN